MPHLQGTSIEILNPSVRRGAIRTVLFDFDGTLSLIRQGWQDVMVPMMVRVIRQETNTKECEHELSKIVRDYVDRLTGKQTIYQMIQLADEIEARGGSPRAPLEYKRRYHDELWERVGHRVEALRSGRLMPDALLVPGSLEMLEGLRNRRVPCFLASGTDEAFVRDEASALGIAGYFESIHGAQDDYRLFSKAQVIAAILSDNDLAGPSLAVIGDGYVEIENAREVGAVAVGIASDEERREGIDAWKRDRLLSAGADVVVPDFREWAPLLRYLFAEEEYAVPAV